MDAGTATTPPPTTSTQRPVTCHRDARRSRRTGIRYVESGEIRCTPLHGAWAPRADDVSDAGLPARSVLPDDRDLRDELDAIGLADRLPLLLVAIGSVVRARLDAALADVDLSVRDVGVLSHLAADPGLSFSELARRAGVTVQSMHTLVRRLLERGLVARAAVEQPGLPATLRVTRDGVAALRRAADIAATVEDEVFAALDADDRAALTAVLRRFPRPGAANPQGG